MRCVFVARIFWGIVQSEFSVQYNYQKTKQKRLSCSFPNFVHVLLNLNSQLSCIKFRVRKIKTRNVIIDKSTLLVRKKQTIPTIVQCFRKYKNRTTSQGIVCELAWRHAKAIFYSIHNFRHIKEILHFQNIYFDFFYSKFSPTL